MTKTILFGISNLLIGITYKITSPPLAGGDIGDGEQILVVHPHPPPSRGRVRVVLSWSMGD
jgi:hypothetical protein